MLNEKRNLRRNEVERSANYSAPKISRRSEINLQFSQELSLIGVGPETIVINSVNLLFNASGFRLMGNHELFSSRLNPSLGFPTGFLGDQTKRPRTETFFGASEAGFSRENA